jgi:hypothetical protein
MIIENVPTRHWWNGKRCTTEAGRKLLDLIGKTIKEGGAVDLTTREDHTFPGKQRQVYEYMSGTITPANKETK